MPSWRLDFKASVLLATIASLLAACGGGSSGAPPAAPAPVPSSVSVVPPAKRGNHFRHVVIVIQENRSFDNLFATFPGADGAKTGKTHDGSTVVLQKGNLNSSPDPPHTYNTWATDYNGGAMNGFDLAPVYGKPATYVYQYVDPAQIKPYWDLARQYVLADHLFQTQGSGSFTAHQDLIAGGTAIGGGRSVIDYPSADPWGCDAPPGTVTSLITVDNQYLAGQGPFPCFTYRTLRDLLDHAKISWKYYTPAVQTTGGAVWNAFDAIKAVRYGPEWQRNESSPETAIFTDIARGTLPAVSWVIPDLENSDHAGDNSDTGPSWVAQIVNAIGKSPAWKNTAILILWDDWGGWYDHVAPPGPRRSGGPGFRVPMIVVSPYAKRGYVAHATYEFGSIVKFVENNWNLPRLGTTDVHAPDFTDDFFDFSRTPRTFVPIAAKYSKEYFLHQRPSGLPVDTE